MWALCLVFVLLVCLNEPIVFLDIPDRRVLHKSSLLEIKAFVNFSLPAFLMWHSKFRSESIITPWFLTQSLVFSANGFRRSDSFSRSTFAQITRISVLSYENNILSKIPQTMLSFGIIFRPTSTGFKDGNMSRTINWTLYGMIVTIIQTSGINKTLHFIVIMIN